MRAGNLDKKIKLFPKVITRDQYNASKNTWPEEGDGIITTRGEIRYTGGSKTLSGEERFYSKIRELTIRYRPGIIETMRIQVDGETDRYEITSNIEEIGRKRALRMTIEKINL